MADDLAEARRLEMQERGVRLNLATQPSLQVHSGLELREVSEMAEKRLPGARPLKSSDRSMKCRKEMAVKHSKSQTKRLLKNDSSESRTPDNNPFEYIIAVSLTVKFPARRLGGPLEDS